MSEAWPWVTLILLGAYHGLNPGMGWLFAVALGLQERSVAAVRRAFAPIVLGHAISVAVVVGLVAALQAVISPTLLRYLGAGALIAFGLYKLLAPMSHPRWVGMRVGFRDLTVWSFLMATAHGAGLMLVPVLMHLPSSGGHDHAAQGHAAHTAAMPQSGHADHSQHMEQMVASAGITGPLPEIAAVVLHTAAMFLVMAVIAIVVYQKVGLAILRRAWFNLDLLWAAALIGAGVLTFVF